MSNLTYSNYEGYGQYAYANYGYSQAVRVGDSIEISGQGVPSYALFFVSYTDNSQSTFTDFLLGGWDSKSGPPVLVDDLDQQIEQAFLR